MATMLPAILVDDTNVPVDEVRVVSLLGWAGQPPELRVAPTADGRGLVATMSIRSQPVFSVGRLVGIGKRSGT
jgi:hypothetical protein